MPAHPPEGAMMREGTYTGPRQEWRGKRLMAYQSENPGCLIAKLEGVAGDVGDEFYEYRAEQITLDFPFPIPPPTSPFQQLPPAHLRHLTPPNPEAALLRPTVQGEGLAPAIAIEKAAAATVTDAIKPTTGPKHVPVLVSVPLRNFCATYVSHKEVRAARIAEISSAHLGVATMAGMMVVPYDILPPAIFARYTPVVGDYLLFYRDGYISISPQSEFEDGYTLKS